MEEDQVKKEATRGVATIRMTMAFHALGMLLQIPVPNENIDDIEAQVLDSFNEVGEAKVLRQLLLEDYADLEKECGKSEADKVLHEIATKFGESQGSKIVSDQVTAFLAMLESSRDAEPRGPQHA
jgi:hypothetical protein